MGAPPVWNFVKQDEDRKLLRFLMTAQTIGRPYIMPPDSPPEADAIIRKAFDRVLQDPNFLEDAARATLEVAPISAARMREVLTESFQSSPELIERRALGPAIGARRRAGRQWQDRRAVLALSAFSSWPGLSRPSRFTKLGA